MPDQPFRIVSVAGSPDGSAEELSFAEELGRLLAGAGFAVACGGGGGVMEAVCRGAAGEGGTTIGILPGSGPCDANPFVSIPIPTGLGSGRNRIVALAGIALIAVGGKYGTLSEIGHALDAGRPVCAFGRWSIIPGVESVTTPREALQFARRTWEVDPC